MEWVLAFSIWYSLVSLPDGSWRYNQFVDGLNSFTECESLARKKYKDSDRYTWKLDMNKLPYDVVRQMRIIDRQHWCLTKEQFKDLNKRNNEQKERE